MNRRELTDQGTKYFGSSDHWRRLLALLQDPDPRNSHVHTYVYTSVHPESLHDILVAYFALRGWPLVRRINRIRPRPGIGALHGIEPEGKLHFDFHWIYKPDVGVTPADGIEGGSNLLMWNRFYIEEFNRSFPFRSVGPQEEEALRSYFSSRHWEEGLQFVSRPDVPHMHINVEVGVHPSAVAEHALEALKRRGWEVYYVCPNAFLMGTTYRGKLVFMGKKPEKVYDIGWKFNPDVTIRPAEETWMFPDRVGYDVMTDAMTAEETNKHPFVTLTPDEVSAVVEACAGR